jgi:molybdopterin-containing oxidoreductase family iron-sulfur binding subunit
MHAPIARGGAIDAIAAAPGGGQRMVDPEPRARPAVSRRSFLQGLVGGAAAASIASYEVFAIGADDAAPPRAAPAVGPATALSSGGDQVDVLERMRAELVRALQKPAADRRWVMVIDLRKCAGCHACTIACVAENKLPPGVVYRPVIEEEWGTYPNVGRRFIPRPCMQCDQPPCVPVCPVDATHKDDEGVVVVDYPQCIGCRACLTACPYGARTADFGLTYTEPTPVADGLVAGRETAAVYEKAPSFEYGTAWPRDEEGSPMGNARKCHFCLHRVKAGELPACVTTCIGRATLFGDANDPTSVVAGLIAQQNVTRLKEVLGTQPRVYYLA